MNWSTSFAAPAEFIELENGRYLCSITLGLTVEGTTRIGIGAATGSDPDDVVKTALAEAIKKAGNQFGIGLYLWNEEKRAEIESWRTKSKTKVSVVDGQDTAFAF